MITLKRIPEISLNMSNGLTSVFISAFGLSGSVLAKTEQEKNLVMYVLEKNQSVFGIGFVDFDIGCMPWDADNFDENKNFILSIVKGMYNETGWEKMSYSPNKQMLTRCINEFEKLIMNMKRDDINIQEINEWFNAKERMEFIKNGFPLCEIHNVLSTIYGCQLCTD